MNVEACISVTQMSMRAVSPFTQVLIMGIYKCSTIILSAVMEGACAGAADQDCRLQYVTYHKTGLARPYLLSTKLVVLQKVAHLT
jgi:hypothetical protein